jgi:CRISPR subtype II RNA-guided endonuclease Cas9/Csn1
MKTILGLDLGTNSIGWALIKENNNILQCIEGTGSRIIPEKDEHRDYESGRDISKNAVRRQKRGSRRLKERYQLRRDNLIRLCKILVIIPKGLDPLFANGSFDSKIKLPQGAFVKGDHQFRPHELYELRTRALTQKILLEELFRIIYHFNQRRGFKSNKKAISPEEQEREAIVDEDKKKPEIIVERVKIVSVEPTGERKGKQKREEFRVTLEDGRTATTDKYIFKKFAGETTIIEIKKEVLKSAKEPKYTFTIPSKWKRNRKELNDAIIASGGFPGKYFYEEYLRAKREGRLYEFKVRESIVNRELYENEFQTIWDKQYELWKAEGADTNFLPSYQKAIESIVPANNKEEKAKWLQKGLGEFIKKYIIYYQRDLKSQTKTISDCRFEERYYEVVDEDTGEITFKRDGPKCCPKSHPLFQEFRIWQQINNLICRNEREEEFQLDEDTKVALFNYMNGREDAEPEDLVKELKKKNSTVSSINVVKTWAGNKTLHFFRKIFKANNYDGTHILSNPQKYFQLWHLLYSVGDEKGIKTGLKKIDSNLPESIIKTFCEIDYKEKQYSSMSLKAIKNLLPLMSCGKLFNEDTLTEKCKTRIQQFLKGELDTEFDEKTLLKLKEKKNLTDFKGLSYYQAASLLYGKHTAKQGERYERPEDVLPVPQHSLRNPVVEQIVNETLMLVKDIWKQHPELKDGEIRIEFARDLKSSKEERQKISEAQERNKETNQTIVEEIRRHKGNHYNPTLAEIEKVKLWKEAKMRSPYTGKELKISEVLSENVEVDHIIPRTRFYNDGLVNKVVCESHINADKGNMTAYEYMNAGTRCQNEKLSYEAFLQLIKDFPYSKRRMLTMQEIPDDFIERQKKDTQYIVTRVKEELGKIVGIQNVKTTTGSVTDYLKEQWGIAELMKRLIKPRFELLQEKFKAPLVSEEDVLGRNDKPTGKKRTVIKGYSKRFDHRHHAIDALIVACTRQGIIQQLNLLNQITKGKTKQIEETVGDSFRKFIPPTGREDKNANKFYHLVEDAVNSIIVSYKNRKRLVSKGINWYQRYNPVTGKIEKVKQDNMKLWAVKGSLHNETNYGIITYKGIMRFTSRCELSALTDNKIDNIPDESLQKEIREHINKEEYGDIKKAFGPEGIIEFNKNRKVPIFSVTVMEDGAVDEVKGKTFLYDKERKLAVEKGGNYCVAIYEHPETKERKFEVVSFFDAVLLKTSEQNPFQTEEGIKFERDGYKFLFTLTHNDLVYVPDDGESIEHIDWNSKRALFDKIYRLVKFSGTDLYFQPHNYSKEITIHEGKVTAAKDYKGEFNKGTNGTHYVIGTKKLIRDYCIKLQVDRLGNIKPAQ